MLISGDGTLADDLKVIGAFIGGLVLIALELVTPGIGIFGVAGILLLFGSLFWMLGATVQALYILAGGIVIAVILFYILGRRLPKSRLFAKVALTTRSTKEKGYTSQEDKSKYLFQRGTTITILRPAGTIRIGCRFERRLHRPGCSRARHQSRRCPGRRRTGAAWSIRR